MLKMRLQRVGRRNNPQFRVVLTESRNAADGGKFQEVLGSYNPHVNTIQLKADRIGYWLSQGVKPSDTVHNLLVSEKIIDGKKVNVLPKKRPIVKESGEEEGDKAPESAPDAPQEDKAQSTDGAADSEGDNAEAQQEPQEDKGDTDSLEEPGQSADTESEDGGASTQEGTEEAKQEENSGSDETQPVEEEK